MTRSLRVEAGTPYTFPKAALPELSPQSAAGVPDDPPFGEEEVGRAKEFHPDPGLLEWRFLSAYVQESKIPWAKVDGKTVFAAVSPARQEPSAQIPANDHGWAVPISKSQLSRALQARFFKHLTVTAVCGLAKSAPVYSAHIGFSRGQAIIVAGLLCLACAGYLTSPTAAIEVAKATIYGIVCVMLMLKAGCIVGAAAMPARHGSPDAEQPGARGPKDHGLPFYTVLVPMYREQTMVSRIVDALDALDYPDEKLDIKLIVEEYDVETLAAAIALDLDDRFEIIRVPQSQPRTKPKACNYALPLAKGKFIVIYDVEDRPQPDQLRKAAHAFARLPDDVICLQARLGFYNSDDNWLTKQFAVEYAIWFHLFLPGLRALGLPVPLGGTSNHFRASALRALGAWDAFNVTEDADLGMRIAGQGLKTEILNSTTFEEANSNLTNWINQRSRWQKGYLQTWLVHGRRPGDKLKRMGVWKLAGQQCILGGSLIVGAAPLCILALSVAEGLLTGFGDGEPSRVLSGALVSKGELSFFGATFGLAVLAAVIALERARLPLFLPALATMPAYWFLIGAGTAKGICQFFTKRTYWAKTRHGLSKPDGRNGTAAINGPSGRRRLCRQSLPPKPRQN